jgi:hypothetical protein
MPSALANFGIGLAVSIGSAVVLWLCARQARRAKGSGVWASDWAATLSSLGLVGAIVVAMAWTMRGAMLMVPDQMLGSLVGFAASMIVLATTLRLLGPLPR